MVSLNSWPPVRRMTAIMKTRIAGPRDARAVAALISLAYRVEDFFKIGDRTDEADVLLTDGEGRVPAPRGSGDDERRARRSRLRRHPRRDRLLRHALDRPGAARAGPRTAARSPRPRHHCRNAGCREMELEVVNLRTELPPFYRRFGYAETVTRPVPRSRTGEAPLPLHRHDEVAAAGRLSTPGRGQAVHDSNSQRRRFARARPDAIQLWSLSRNKSHLDHKTLQEDGWLLGVGRLCVRRYCWQVRSSFRHGCRPGPERDRPAAQAPADDNTVPVRPAPAAGRAGERAAPRDSALQHRPDRR